MLFLWSIVTVFRCHAAVDLHRRRAGPRKIDHHFVEIRPYDPCGKGDFRVLRTPRAKVKELVQVVLVKSTEQKLTDVELDLEAT